LKVSEQGCKIKNTIIQEIEEVFYEASQILGVGHGCMFPADNVYGNGKNVKISQFCDVCRTGSFFRNLVEIICKMV